MGRLGESLGTTSELADALYVSESTVKYHIGNILKKTKCSNRSELIKKFCSGKSYKHRVFAQPGD